MSRIAMLTLTILCLFLGAACTKQPSKEIVKDAVGKVMPGSYEITGVRPVEGIGGLYEVVVTMGGGQPVIFYMDGAGKYLVSGSIIETATKKNLTLEQVKKMAPPTSQSAQPPQAGAPPRKPPAR